MEVLRPWMMVLMAGCRLGFEPPGEGSITTVNIVTPVIGATDVVPSAFVFAPDGGTLIAGSVNTGSGFDWAIARLAPSGEVDRSFGTDGAIVIDLGSEEDIANAIAVGPRGEIVVVGEIGIDGSYDSVAARVTANGQLDLTFGNGGLGVWSLSTMHNLDDRAFAVAFDDQGRAIVAGYRNTAYPGWEDTYVTRLAADGSPDPSFGTDGIVTTRAQAPAGGDTNDFPSSIAIDSQDRIVVGLTCSDDACVFRYTADGVPDPTFGTTGQLAVDLGGIDAATGFLVDTDDSIFVAGSALAMAPRTVVVAHVTAAGALDAAFGTNGRATLAMADDARAQAITSDGAALYVAGTVHTATRNEIVMKRLTRTGVYDTSFGGSYLLDAGGADVRGLAVDFGGRIALLARAADRAVVVRQDPALPWPMDSLSSLATPPFAVVPAGADSTLIAGATLEGTTRAQPRRAGTLAITGAVTWSAMPAYFIAASQVVWSPGSSLAADGEDGGVPTSTTAGHGGAGASGGGSGSSPYSGFAGFGGRFGRSGQSVGGIGGIGHAWSYAQGFFYGLGGAGGSGRGCCPPRVPGGEAGNGGGGGGGGAWTNYYTGGGGGGGGLVVIVADSITGPGRITARGGHGYSINGAGSGGGGGGVIWIATRSYDGATTVDVSGGSMNVNEPGERGTARIFQILPDGPLVARAFTDVW